MEDDIFSTREDEETYSDYHGNMQYLGKHGITQRCVHAMGAILTSTYQPKKMTMISLPQGEGKWYAGDAVMFVAWDWLKGPDLTVIPDGFGTHGGEGGRGLSAVLSLLRYMQIPVEHLSTSNREGFFDLAEYGKLSPELFLELLHSVKPYNWTYYRVGEISIIKQKNGLLLKTEYGTFPIKK